MKIPRGRRVTKARLLKEKYVARLNFRRGGERVRTKKPSGGCVCVGGGWSSIFSGTTH